MKTFLAIGLLLYSISSFIPLLNSDHWMVRYWDFPRMQFFVIGLVFLMAFVYWAIRNSRRALFFLLLPLIAMGLDVYRLYPYTPLSPIESKLHKDKKHDFSVMIFNVLQTNKERKNLHDLIRKKSPDFVFLFEVDDVWVKSLDQVKGYPYRQYHPLDNTYGIAFMGKIPIDNIKLNFLVQSDIPSYEIKFRPKGHETVTIFAVHPRPPRPHGRSDDRDAELVLIAKKSKEVKGPVLVVGDMNDVAWSHTTRLFRRISGLLDPRVGRHPFATFPAIASIFRFPLDYIFHSPELKLTGIEVLPDIESDHLPLMASFVLAPQKEQVSFEEPQEGDSKEAREIIKKGLEN